MNLDNFKPNLIPNNPKDGSFDEVARNAKIKQNGGYDKYLVTMKKDGCRLQLLGGKVLTRSLKEPKSVKVIERFAKLAQICDELNIAIDGEFYAHGMKFNAIYRFFTKADVTCPKYRAKLEKEFKKDPEKFSKEYDGLSIDFLTTFHDGLEFWLFDGIVLDRPDLVRYEDRINEIMIRLLAHKDSETMPINMPNFTPVYDAQGLDTIFRYALKEGYEGLVLTHKDHEYKFGRNSLNQGTILKIKDDEHEYDGIILDVLEGTQIKEGIKRSKNELGNSVTSKKKGDREASGMAKGFLIQFEDKGTFVVGLKDFDNEKKEELLKNKDQYIGRHFKFTAMKPVKDFPRHAFFSCWRDEK